MKKIATTFLVLAAIVGVFTGQSLAQVKNVKKIYLAPFGNNVSADLIREKIKSRLINSSHFVVVEKPDDADAVFTGVTDFERIDDSSVGGVNNGGRKGGVIWGETNTDFNAVGVFRLIHPETKAILWIYDYKPKWYRTTTGLNKVNNEYNRIAKRVVERLIKDIRPS